MRRKTNKDTRSNLDDMVASGKEGAYEALQLYKSKVNRHKFKKNWDEAISISFQASICLLSHGYETAGGEMANLLINLFELSNSKLDIDNRSKINEIDSKFITKSQIRQDFLKLTLKWSKITGDRENGDIMINYLYACCLWENNQINKAIYYFVLSESPEKLWIKINERYTDISTQPEREGERERERERERDQIITLAIVHFIALENLRDGNILISCVLKSLDPSNSEESTSLSSSSSSLSLSLSLSPSYSSGKKPSQTATEEFETFRPLSPSLSFI